MANLGVVITPEDAQLGGSTLPPGTYDVVIVEEFGKDANKVVIPEGSILQPKQMFFSAQVLAGKHASEIIKWSINIIKNDGQRNDGGVKAIGKMAFMMGLGAFNDSKELVGKPFAVKVVLKDSNKLNPSTNKPYQNPDVVDYFKRGEGQPAVELPRAEASSPNLGKTPQELGW